MKSLKRIHRTCVYEEFEDSTYDMFIWREDIGHVIWRVWREYIGHVYLKSFKRIHSTCLYEEFEENT